MGYNGIWLNNDSTDIGNYNNNLWNITNINAKYSIDYGNNFNVFPYKKTSTSDVLLTTGAYEKFLLINIYDVAGNLGEWTLEKNSDNNGSNSSANHRFTYDTSYNDFGIGFRIGLWK